MKFSERDYRKNLDGVQGLFTLGGMSECGKTTAGNRFHEIGVRKSKIIHIEYDMMRDRGMHTQNGLKPEDFESLYEADQHAAFREFLFRLIEKMKEEGYGFASLESLYRAPLGAFLKNELQGRAANIYIESPLEVRARRETDKYNAKAAQNGENAVSYEEILEKIRMKDAFKRRLKAEDVKTIADYVVDNSEKTSKEDFLVQIDAIAIDKGVVIPHKDF